MSKETGLALIRQCDGCGMTTAFDLDPTPENEALMRHDGQTVLTVSKDEAKELWKNSGKCKCKEFAQEFALKIDAIKQLIDGYLDGAPDASPASKLANQINQIIHPQ
jgi:hypothetical protein